MIAFSAEARPGLKFFSMQDELEQILGCRVDIVTRRAVERSDNPIRRRAILSSARQNLESRQAAYLIDILRSAEIIT